MLHQQSDAPDTQVNVLAIVCIMMGPVLCLLVEVSSDYAQPIIDQFTEVTCPVIGRAQPELIPSKRQKQDPDWHASIQQKLWYLLASQCG